MHNITRATKRAASKVNVNFEKIVVTVSCFDNSRVLDMYATVASLILSLNSGRIVILLNDLFENFTSESKERFLLLERLADHQGVELQTYYNEPSVSLAQMYWLALHTRYVTNSKTYWMSVDDDVLVPRKTLKAVENETKLGHSLILYGFYELINQRGYDDWVCRKLEWSPSEVELIKELYGEKSLIHQSWKVGLGYEPHLMSRGQHSGSFVVKIEDLKKNSKLLNTLKTWPKGRRGVDVEICKSIKSKPVFLAGATAYHTDRTKSTLNNNLWKEDVPEQLKIGEDRK